MKRFLILPLLCAVLSSCAGRSTAERRTIIAMDAAATVEINSDNADEAFKNVEQELYRLDSLMSRGRETSDVYKLNESGFGEVSPDTAAAIDAALGVSRETNGAFDITIAPLIDAWGFFNQDYHVPSDAELQSVLPEIGYANVELSENSVTLKNGARIDLGGIAKGYACESAARILRNGGVSSALISFGGSSIKALGVRPDGKPWKIGITNPLTPTEYFLTLEISDECVSTSGSYERFFEENGKKYHHILDPSTGRPAENGLVSVSVICPDGARADALSTALFVMGLDKAAEFQKKDGGFEAVFITADKTVYITRELKDKLSAVPDGWTCEIISGGE